MRIIKNIIFFIDDILKIFKKCILKKWENKSNIKYFQIRKRKKRVEDNSNATG